MGTIRTRNQGGKEEELRGALGRERAHTRCCRVRRDSANKTSLKLNTLR